MAEDKGKKDKKQERDSQVTFSDAKGNKILVGGSINGYAVRRIANTMPTRAPGRITGLDKSWKGRRVLVILLEE